MKKITLLVIAFFALTVSALAQYSFPSIVGPTNVAAGAPVTLNVNDAANSAAAPASSTGSYSSFSITVDWVAGGGFPWSSEADLTVNTTSGSVLVNPPTTGGANSGAATTMTFEGDLAGPYDPTVDGFLDIVLNQSYGGSDANWSNIVVTLFETPTCAEPTGLTVGNISAASADVSWTAFGTESEWEVVVQTAGTGAPTGSGTATTSNPYSAGGLSAATDYEVYVRANCLTDGFSAWVGPVNFTTACTVFIPEYIQDFSTIIPNCWEEADAGDATTGPTNLGASSWSEDGFLNNGFTGAYQINLWLASKSDWLLSPQFDLTGGPFQVDFDFGIMQYGSSTNAGTLGSDDTVQLFISSDNGTTWTNLLTFDNTSVVPATGMQVIYDLTPYSGQTVQFGILGSEGVVDDPEDNQVFVDNFRVREIPSCSEPTGLTVDSVSSSSVTVSWTPFGSETDWEVAVQPVGTGVPSGSGTATTNNPHTETGLSPSTEYEVYVRANCLTNGFSTWVGPVNFITECTSFIAPYTQGFENGGDIPLCWSMSGGEDWNFDNVPGFNHIGNNGTITGSTITNDYFAWVDASGDNGPTFLLSPLVDVTPLTTPALSFFELSDNEGNANAQLDVEVWDGAAWNMMGTYNTNTSGWELKIIDLSGLTITGDVQARFTFSEPVPGDFYDDIAIDDVTFDELPACVTPGGIAVNNITGTTADVTWMPGGGETEWEYVYQLAGTGEPTGSGTATTVTAANLTGLSYQTDYEIYVRSNCGADGFSDWIGPVNFTTTIQTDFAVDCAVGPVINSLCYENNDSPIFTFTSSDGSPLNLVFNSGQVEGAPFDFLAVYDTDGTQIYYGEGNNGDISGLAFQSTGDTISFQIESDGSVSCASNSFCCSDGIDYTVSCATCINHSATYQVVDDCANGDQFLVDVNITDMGDATSLLISDNQGSLPVSVSSTGTTQFGPYPFLIDVIFTIENEQDVNCVITSPAIQLAACPPDNDNPCDAIVAVVNSDQTCDMTTPGTILEATPSGVPNTACGGNPDDDVWYQFTALEEFQLISLTNITGGTWNLDHAVYEGACDNLVEVYCSDQDASITPQLTVGNTYYIRVFSNGSDSETSTFDLCIRKAPENVSCEDAANFCSGGGDALYTSSVIGIPDNTSVACLGTIPNPSWNLIQIGESGPVEIEIVQNTAFDANGNPIGTGLDVDFVLWGPFTPETDFCELDLLVDCPSCPNNTWNPDFYPYEIIVDCSYSAAPVENATIPNALEGEIYVLLITNYSGDAGTIQVQQTNAGVTGAGVITADIEVEAGDDQVLCGFPDYTIVADSPFADTFEWYQDGIYLDGQTEGSITVTESGTYTVFAYDEQCATNAQDTVTITFYDEAIATQPLDIEVCDDPTADGFEAFDLESQTAQVLGALNASDFVVTYHETLVDAQTGIGALTSPFTNTQTLPQTIYVRVEDVDAVGSNSGCFATTSFNLVIAGVTPTATSVNLEACDDMNDGVEAFDLESNSANILDGQSDTAFTVTYYETQADAESGTGALTSPYTNTSSPQTLWARVENVGASQCYATTSFDLVLSQSPETIFSEEFDYVVCPNATIPIEIGIIPQNYTESEVTIRWYLDGVEITGENSTVLSTVLIEGDYTAEVTFNDTNCSASVTTFVTELESCVIPQAITPNSDGYNDNFDLSSYDVHSLEIYNRYGVLVYSKTDYINEWHGQSDSGDELPVGTYFYVMKYRDNQVKTSWVYINK